MATTPRHGNHASFTQQRATKCLPAPLPVKNWLASLVHVHPSPILNCGVSCGVSDIRSASLPTTPVGVLSCLTRPEKGDGYRIHGPAPRGREAQGPGRFPVEAKTNRDRPEQRKQHQLTIMQDNSQHRHQTQAFVNNQQKAAKKCGAKITSVRPLRLPRAKQKPFRAEHTLMTSH